MSDRQYGAIPIASFMLPQSPRCYHCGTYIINHSDARWSPLCVQTALCILSSHRIPPFRWFRPNSPPRYNTAGSYTVLSRLSQATSIIPTCCAAGRIHSDAGGSFLTCYSCNHAVHFLLQCNIFLLYCSIFYSFAIKNTSGFHVQRLKFVLHLAILITYTVYMLFSACVKLCLWMVRIRWCMLVGTANSIQHAGVIYLLFLGYHPGRNQSSRSY